MITKEFIMYGIFVDGMNFGSMFRQPNIFSMSFLRNIFGISKIVEFIYLRQMLRDTGSGPTSPTPVYEDTTACIEWTNNVIGGKERAKHVYIRKHFAHEAAQIGHLRLKRVSTDDQLANVFTKSPRPVYFATIIARLLRRTWP